MRSGELAIAVEIPSGFGRDVANLHSPEVAFWVDGAMPFRGETTKGYVTGLEQRYAQDLIVERLGPNAASNVYIGSVNVEIASATIRLSRASSPWFRSLS